MYSWSDLKNNNIESVYSKDTLLANIMVYIVTKTFNTASWIYYGRREEGGRFFPKDFKKLKFQLDSNVSRRNVRMATKILC